VVILDGRPLAEYRKMTIPSSICCPNGELGYRIREVRNGHEALERCTCALAGNFTKALRCRLARPETFHFAV